MKQQDDGVWNESAAAAELSSSSSASSSSRHHEGGVEYSDGVEGFGLDAAGTVYDDDGMFFGGGQEEGEGDSISSGGLTPRSGGGDGGSSSRQRSLSDPQFAPIASPPLPEYMKSSGYEDDGGGGIQLQLDDGSGTGGGLDSLLLPRQLDDGHDVDVMPTLYENDSTR